MQKREESKKFSLAVKRCIDIVGSGLALICGAPIFGAIALAIKATSEGPVLFKQERLGQYGKPFVVLKFRSMRTNCDAQIHEKYVHQFIAGHVDNNSDAGKKPVFKIQAIRESPQSANSFARPVWMSCLNSGMFSAGICLLLAPGRRSLTSTRLMKCGTAAAFLKSSLA